MVSLFPSPSVSYLVYIQLFNYLVYIQLQIIPNKIAVNIRKQTLEEAPHNQIFWFVWGLHLALGEFHIQSEPYNSSVQNPSHLFSWEAWPQIRSNYFVSLLIISDVHASKLGLRIRSGKDSPNVSGLVPTPFWMRTDSCHIYWLTGRSGFHSVRLLE